MIIRNYTIVRRSVFRCVAVRSKPPGLQQCKAGALLLTRRSQILRRIIGAFTLLLLLMTVGSIHAQDFLKEADACLIKGDYKCVVRNLRLQHEETGQDVNKQVADAENCEKYLVSADVLFEAGVYANAEEFYKKILDINPKDAYAKKQYGICLEKQGKTSAASNTTANTNWDIEMIFVQGGTFMMGCTSEQGDDCYDFEKPVHQVTLSSYYIGKYEVTQKQWKEVMGTNPSSFKGDNLPVEKVSWDDVQKFIEKLNQKTGKQYRLPTEAEWEYAARGGNQSQGYKYSGSNTVGNVAWYRSKTNQAGTKKANELGIYDMSGNVWEWCSDWYGDYSSSSQMNPTGAESGSYRVYRGGGWSSDAGGVRVTLRNYGASDFRNFIIGFRLASGSK